jgi:malonyl-CoA O-methyltransferase
MSHDTSTLASLSSSDAPHRMDPVAVRRWLSYPQMTSPWLHDEVGQRMAQRLAWITTPVSSWLNWEPIQGGEKTHNLVHQRYPDASFFYHSTQLKSAEKAIKKVLFQNASLWKRWQGLEALQWTPATKVDLLWANMALHQYGYSPELLQLWLKSLNNNGFLMFSCLGPDSLKELKAVYSQLEWGPAAHDYTDMHDWGDLLVQSGFAEPVMDMERITLTYPSVQRLLADLRQMGRNLHPQRHPKTKGRVGYHAWCAALDQHWPRTPEGHIGLTFEIIYGHAHKPVQNQNRGDKQIVLSDMRLMLGMTKSFSRD